MGFVNGFPSVSSRGSGMSVMGRLPGRGPGYPNQGMVVGCPKVWYNQTSGRQTFSINVENGGTWPEGIIHWRNRYDQHIRIITGLETRMGHYTAEQRQQAGTGGDGYHCCGYT